ncbi:hypothetical protein [Calothrix sp. PCC 6303]|uniref:hypothetical protein n=1 Tax=Calothrix sp. PCC 6303 TaxID=1170562 RepID=UPI0002A00A80|nr:hypothetical protein [Calothrix sp. PCC 6303]AFZ00814.1 hypothetical protein Cal6303_1776 [Calothrix sp. PCC 6303]
MMPRLNQLFVAAGISLLALTGCNGAEQSPTTSTTSASPVSNAASTDGKSSYGSLLAVVSKTKTAVDAGDFPTAKKEFDEFEESWSTVEDGIKAKSSKSYDLIEENADEVNDLLKEPKPVKAKLTTALQSLESNIKAAPQP